MTEKGTPPLPDPLPRPSGGEGEGMSRALAKHVPDVSRRKSGSYKTVHWQALDSQDGSTRVSLVTSAATRTRRLHSMIPHSTLRT